MRKYNARAATDVTGFGILGHTRNLAEHQKNYVELQVLSLSDNIKGTLLCSDSQAALFGAHC